MAGDAMSILSHSPVSEAPVLKSSIGVVCTGASDTAARRRSAASLLPRGFMRIRNFGFLANRQLPGATERRSRSKRLH
jgi:hypothetical protein